MILLRWENVSLRNTAGLSTSSRPRPGGRHRAISRDLPSSWIRREGRNAPRFAAMRMWPFIRAERSCPAAHEPFETIQGFDQAFVAARVAQANLLSRFLAECNPGCEPDAGFEHSSLAEFEGVG